MADLNKVISEYRAGNYSLNELQEMYNLSPNDLQKLKDLNIKIANELGVNDDNQYFPNSKELILDDGTKVLALLVRTVNQPDGGFINLYSTQDYKQYYQYTDKEGVQQKVTDSWDSLSATGDNIKVAWSKFQEGFPLEALIMLVSGPEDPRLMIAGTAPGVGISKGVGFFKSMKNFGKWFKEFKKVKTFEQFKSSVLGFMQKFRPVNQIKPSKNLSDGIDVSMYNALGKRNLVAQAFRFGNAAERHQGVLTAENTAKIISNLTKTLGKNINPKDLKVVSLANGNHYAFQISYFDNATGKVFCYLADGTPNQVLKINHSNMGKIKDYDLVAGWLDNNWVDF